MKFKIPGFRQGILCVGLLAFLSVYIPCVIIKTKNAESFLFDRSMEYQKRKTLMKMICQKYNNTLRQVHGFLLWDRQHDVSYCDIPKVGTTTWKIYFVKILNIPELTKDWTVGITGLHYKVQTLFEKPNGISHHEWMLLQQNTFKFTFVRNPFTRLVSFFQDKVIDSDDQNFRRKFNDTIFWSRKFRTDTTVPTFGEFAELLILKPEVLQNPHLIQFWHRCNFCNIDYDVIGKMESIKEDTQYILETLGWSEKINVQEKHHESTKPENNGTKMSSDELAKQYFRQLNSSTVMKLYDLYKIDFEMLGYTTEGYIHT